MEAVCGVQLGLVSRTDGQPGSAPGRAATAQENSEGAWNDDVRTNVVPTPGLCRLRDCMPRPGGIGRRDTMHMQVRRPVLRLGRLRVHRSSGWRTTVRMLRHGAEQYVVEIQRRRLPDGRDRTGRSGANEHRFRRRIQCRPEGQAAAICSPVTATGRAPGRTAGDAVTPFRVARRRYREPGCRATPARNVSAGWRDSRSEPRSAGG